MTDTITITGNIATEPEQRRTPSGVPVTTFRVASGQRRFDRTTNSWVDAGTNWFSVSAFRGLAEHAFRSLSKGDRVILTGRLRLREWETGTKKGLSAEIDVDAIGHDLRFGVSRFEKDTTATMTGSDAVPGPAAVTEWPVTTIADGWAVPGADPADEPVLVGAMIGDGPSTSGAESGDTPF
ncbi:single-stranded DNA-binding protein [Microbacterium sp. B2969]|uniref:Single-stranded DNA-binding protein n=1 Tax=Microbacterium alkaliflavum TaxID=3248839 RepID=A0ABW7Q5A7_9MICO